MVSQNNYTLYDNDYYGDDTSDEETYSNLTISFMITSYISLLLLLWYNFYMIYIDFDYKMKIIENRIDIIDKLLNLLNDDGYLFISTPNELDNPDALSEQIKNSLSFLSLES